MYITFKHIFRIVITMAIVIGSMYFALQNINLDILLTTLLNAKYEWVLLSIPVMLISHWLRALRWKTMLSPVVEKPSLLNMFSAVMIGYAVNNVIPKGGELLRPIIYSRRDKVPLSTVMASMIVERFFFDAIMNIQAKLLKKLALNEHQVQLSPKERSIIAYIENHAGCKSGEISEKLNIPNPTVKRLLTAIVKMNLIEKHGSGAGTNYSAI